MVYTDFSTFANMDMTNGSGGPIWDPTGITTLTFRYTIEDDDRTSPETDTAELSILIGNPIISGQNSLDPASSDFGVLLDVDAVVINEGSVQSFANYNDYLDLTDVFNQEDNHQLDKLLALSGENETDLLEITSKEQGSQVVIEQTVFDELVLENSESSENSVGIENETDNTITNELFVNGAIAISDEALPPSPSLVEFDSAELI